MITPLINLGIFFSCFFDIVIAGGFVKAHAEDDGCGSAGTAKPSSSMFVLEV